MIRVLVVDDSATVRTTLTRELAADPDIQVIGAAPDPYVARDLIVRFKPDVITLDLEMPRMDGLSFLTRLMHHCPLPVIVVSSLTPQGSQLAMRALELGALEVLSKPESAYSVAELGAELIRAVKAAAEIRPGMLHRIEPIVGPAAIVPLTAVGNSIIAIGASTGGTRAIEVILSHLPANAPAIFVVQHMPPRFTTAFAQRLDQITAMEVREAAHGDTLLPGRVLVAPGNRHLLIARSGLPHRVELSDAPRVFYQRPSVEVAFQSAARAAGPNAIGVLLTGMGVDGARGLLDMRTAGAHTIVQDEATSIIFGMPREAIALGAAEQVLPLDAIAPALIALSAHRAAA